MFKAALFVIAKNQINPDFLQQVKVRLWHIHTTEHYSAMKRSATTGTHLPAVDRKKPTPKGYIM